MVHHENRKAESTSPDALSKRHVSNFFQLIKLVKGDLVMAPGCGQWPIKKN